MRDALPQVEVVNTAKMTVEQRGKFLSRLKRRSSSADHTKGPLLLLCTVSTLSHGTDLGFCRELVSMDLVYHHADIEQLRGRLSRIGQIEGVQKLHFLLFKDTFEEKIFRANCDTTARRTL